MMTLFRPLRGLPRAVWVLAGALLVNRAGSMILAFLVLYATRDLGLSAERRGLAVTGCGVGPLRAAPISGRLADRFPPLTIMQASLVFGGLVAMLLTWAKTFWALPFGVLMWAALSEAYRPPSLAIIGGITSPAQGKAGVARIRPARRLG